LPLYVSVLATACSLPEVQPLDAVPWADLGHAYGAAVDVPDWIRALAAGGPDAAGAASEFSAAMLHQGSYFPATPVAVPYLIDALRQPGAARPKILYLLADLSGAHVDDERTEFNPGADYFNYPEARDSIAAVQAGYAVYLPLLGDADPDVRAAAAYLIVGCPEAAEPARADLLARVGTEPDPTVRASQVLALGRLGASDRLTALRDDPDEGVRAAVAIERTRLAATLPTARLASSPEVADDLQSLVDAACSDVSIPWGALGLLAAHAIAELARVRPADAERVLRAAMDLRLAAGHRPINHHESPRSSRPTALAITRDDALTALVTVLTALVFGNLAKRERPVTRDELTEPQAAMLRWTVEYNLAIPVRAAPWYDAERMRRYLDPPAGPLERPLTVTRDGKAETAPTWFWLFAVDRQSPDGVAEALIAQRTPEELVALTRDAFGRDYEGPETARRRLDLLGELLEPHLSTVEHLLAAWARDLGDEPRGDEAALVVVHLATLARARGDVLDESYDALIAASLGPQDRDWLLEQLPPHRRTEVLARLRGAYALRRLLHLGDADEVARRVVAALAPQTSDHFVRRMMTGDLLRALGPAAEPFLRAALERGGVGDPGLFADVLAELEGPSEHIVSVVEMADGLVLRLSAPDGERLAEVATPPHPKHDDLAPLIAALPDPGQVRLYVQTEPDFEYSTVYRLQRLLAEFRVRSVRTRRSTLTSTSAEGSTLTYGGS
jgi:hypothetical protein